MSTYDLFPYAGSQGHVEQAASIERARRDRESGAFSDRARTVLRELERRGMHGGTWQELGEVLGLHHGQISGALSVLHKAGAVFTTRSQRDRCHVYVHEAWRDRFAEEARIDEPVRTKSAIRKDALEKVLLAAELVLCFDGTDRLSLEQLREAVWEVRDL